MKMAFLAFALSLCVVAGCSEDSDKKTGVVRLTNSTATKSITYFKYKLHSTSTWTTSSDLIAGDYYLPPGGVQDFEIGVCGVSLDFVAGSYAGLFGEVAFPDHVIPCGGRLGLTVTD